MAVQAPTVVPKGVFLMNILVEGSMPSNTATKANLDSWIKSAKAPFTCTLDSVAPQPVMETFFSTGRDLQLVVDLSSMKLLQTFNTDVPGAIAFINQKLTGP